MKLGLPSATRLVPPLALMALIFFLSAQPDLSSGLGAWDLVLRKMAHAFLFGTLTLLWLRALGPSTSRALAWAVVITLLYAISDEFHQTFVEGRSGRLLDVAVDAVGIVLAVLIARTNRLSWRWRS